MSKKDEKLLYKSMTDAQLVEATCNKQMSAFDELVIRHSRKLYHNILIQVRAEEEAYHICQKAFLKAFHSLRKLKEPGHFFNWAYKIALDLLPESGSPEDPVLKSICSMPEKQRVVVWHCLVNGEKPEEVASMLGIPHSTLRTRLHHATKWLREKLAYLRDAMLN